MASGWPPRPRTTPPARHRRDAIATIPRAGMGKIPNYFKSAQKELLSLGGKLIDKMKDYDKDNIPTKVRDLGVPAAPSRHRRDSCPSDEVVDPFLDRVERPRRAAQVVHMYSTESATGIDGSP